MVRTTGPLLILLLAITVPHIANLNEEECIARPRSELVSVHPETTLSESTPTCPISYASISNKMLSFRMNTS
jgi:hypothetical protein